MADYNLISMIISKKFSVLIQASLALATLMLFIFWLQHTPPGWMSKLQAIGYSVCHQIPSHSFKIGSMTFPLCSRCTGMYLGVCMGVGVLFTQGKKSGFPPVKVLIIFGLLIAIWLIDGFNSIINGTLGKALLYTPSNNLRFLTGLGMGLCIALTIYILFNLTAWQKQDKGSPIDIRILGRMGLGALLIFSVIILKNEILMNLFAYISTITVVALLTALYTIVWIILLHKENSFSQFNKLLLMINAGLFCALLQITLLDAFRLALTGTWVSLVL